MSEVIFICSIWLMQVNSHNKQFKQTLNARRFWFASGLVLPSNAEGEPGRFGLLNWALCDKENHEASYFRLRRHFS